MKVKILLLTISMFFVSMQFFGQNSNLKAHTNLNISASSNGNLKMSEGVNAQADLKSTSEAIEVLRFKLTCDATSYSDEAIVIFNDSDPTQGAAKLMSMYATAPELWSVKNGLKYSISFLGGLDSTIIIPIDAKAGLPGNYTFTASQLESFGANTEISLEDRVAGTFTRLSDLPAYTFHVNAAATMTGRFYLHFVDKSSIPLKDMTSVSEKELARNFTMYTTNGSIMITSLHQQSGAIAIFDLNGRRIATGRVDGESVTEIDMHGKTGVYIVSVQSSKGNSNSKILVR